jgi:xaa-pro aminopeptidase 1
VLCTEAFTTEFGRFFRFETETLFPFDRSLFDLNIMTPQEIDWVNGYHAQVRQRLLPYLTPEQAEWLKAKTMPLGE